jgi:D-inositol-3-phosphate glycosyltransferase
VGDAGGMNVYVRELVGSLAQAGVDTTVYVRRTSTAQPARVEIEPGFAVVHVDAGAHDLTKEALPDAVDAFGEALLRQWSRDGGVPDAIHANYWLSAVAGHRLKHELGIPLVCTFHTLARVKAEAGDIEPERRAQAEQQVIGCADVVLASSSTEAAQLQTLYDAAPAHLEVVPPGVDHAFFSPGDRAGARKALGLAEDDPVLLFVGRIQPLKGLDVAIGALAELPRPARLLVVGGPSGEQGDATLAAAVALADALGVADRITWVPPQPHHRLSTYYRAADVCLVPSRSESFGLVALEAAACGTPVVAAAVGGLRSLVEHGVTGLLVDDRTPTAFAQAVGGLLDAPALAARMGAAGAVGARRYTWSTTAARLRRIYGDLTAPAPVRC